MKSQTKSQRKAKVPLKKKVPLKVPSKEVSSKEARSKTKQGLTLQELNPKLNPKVEFGGTLLKNSNAKVKRPISTKHPMHLVLRSSMAVGEFSLSSNRVKKPIEGLVRDQCERFGIKLLEYANKGDHLHLLVKVGNRFTFSKFIRALTGVIARLVVGAQRGSPKGQKFWDQRPYSRIVDQDRGDSLIKGVAIKNHLESIGIISNNPRRG